MEVWNGLQWFRQLKARWRCCNGDQEDLMAGQGLHYDDNMPEDSLIGLSAQTARIVPILIDNLLFLKEYNKYKLILTKYINAALFYSCLFRPP